MTPFKLNKMRDRHTNMYFPAERSNDVISPQLPRDERWDWKNYRGDY
jgi:hypothetical protein